jgi:FAD/FMN-containing dehydrogenase
MNQAKQTVVNFGRNVQFHPQQFEAPKSEEELLELIAGAKGCVRGVGSKHAWNDGIQTDATLIDMRHFDYVRLDDEGNDRRVVVGAGCQIKRLLAVLNKHGLTTPSIGLITEQTIAGATATGTHGSGKASLSHYIQAMRVACKPGDKATIRQISSGEELQAGRCSLGCLGVVVDVTLPVVPQYYVEESLVPCQTIEQVLAMEKETPLQQALLMPHTWTFYNQRRCVASENARSGYAAAYRLYWFLGLDILFHLILKFFVSVLRSRRVTRFFYRHLVPRTILTGWKVVDRSDRMLVTKHELFRHLEIEVFVRRSQLEAATEFVIEVLKAADNQAFQISKSVRERIDEHDLGEQFELLRGSFTYHYPICYRRVLPDDTMISMTCGSEEDWYAISFITYTLPRDAFFALGEFLACSMFRLFAARIHWGKWFPFDSDIVQQQYPQLARFREICNEFDSGGIFRNKFISRTMGFAEDA